MKFMALLLINNSILVFCVIQVPCFLLPNLEVPGARP